MAAAAPHTASAVCPAAYPPQSAVQAFFREGELCKLLREVEAAHRCLAAGRSVAASAVLPDVDLATLAPLTAQQFVLLERAAAAGHGGRKPEEDFTEFQIFSEDVALCVAHLHRDMRGLVVLFGALHGHMRSETHLLAPGPVCAEALAPGRGRAIHLSRAFIVGMSAASALSLLPA